jgi:hypothetical protein
MLDSIDSNPSPDSDDRRTESSASARPIRPATISKSEIEYVNRTYRKILRTAAEIAAQAIDLGERLNRMKVRVKAREELWEKWAEEHLEFPLRTAQKLMAAANDKHKLAALGPEGFMAGVWGNRPKELPAPKNAVNGASGDKKKKREEEEEDDDNADNSQHGGPGFSPEFFPDSKNPGKLIFAGFKGLVEWLDQTILKNEGIVAKERLRFVEGLIRWLESRHAAMAPVAGEEKERASNP